MDEQWQPPWHYPWERPPTEPPIPWTPPPPAYPPPPGPPQGYPPAGPPPRTRARRTAWVVTVVGCALLLGGLLATCAPGGSDESTGAVVTPATPLPANPTKSALRRLSNAPSPSPVPPSTSPSPSGSPSESARPSSTARRPGRPRPSASRTTGAAASHPTEDTGGPMLSSLQVCAEAERLGRMQPGSEEAAICRSLYGG